ncbi:hypothetical protein [Actinoplanes sp. NPDC051494]|uniref:hypothetical protein n=1 Tax=Actinoplanes sp. NPDC051494 TaxID=3363907 RepID=UPI0037A50B8A
MFDTRCPRCGARGRVAEPERVAALCHLCRAADVWPVLPERTRLLVDGEVARGHTFQAIRALWQAHPSMSLQQCTEIVTYRSR